MDARRAGWLLSFSAFPGIAAALVSPALARRVRPRWIPVAVGVAGYGAAYAGLAVEPGRAPYLWMTLLGLGQGASISLALSYVAWRSPDARHTAHLSTMAQGIGYLLASLGPVTIGAVHAASGGWTVPLIVLAALLVPQLVSGALASRERFVLAGREFSADHPTRPEPLPALGDDWSVWSLPAREQPARRTGLRPWSRAAGNAPPRSAAGGGWPAGGGAAPADQRKPSARSSLSRESRRPPFFIFRQVRTFPGSYVSLGRGAPAPQPSPARHARTAVRSGDAASRRGHRDRQTRQTPARATQAGAGAPWATEDARGPARHQVYRARSGRCQPRRTRTATTRPHGHDPAGSGGKEYADAGAQHRPGHNRAGLTPAH